MCSNVMLHLWSLQTTWVLTDEIWYIIRYTSPIGLVVWRILNFLFDFGESSVLWAMGSITHFTWRDPETMHDTSLPSNWDQDMDSVMTQTCSMEGCREDGSCLVLLISYAFLKPGPPAFLSIPWDTQNLYNKYYFNWLKLNNRVDFCGWHSAS